MFIFGTMFNLAVFNTLKQTFQNSQVGQKFSENFKLTTFSVLDICNKLTSSCFAIIACSVGVTVLRQCQGDIMHDRYFIIDNFIIYAAAYFFYDLVSMYTVHNASDKDNITVSTGEICKFLTERPLMVFHHILVPTICWILLVYRNDLGDCLIAAFLLLEASTPFVSLRAILVHLNLKVSP